MMIDVINELYTLILSNYIAFSFFYLILLTLTFFLLHFTIIIISYFVSQVYGIRKFFGSWQVLNMEKIRIELHVLKP